MPVSSSTSRTAACSAVSPASMCPLGSDQSSRPRRSSRPITAAGAGGVVDDEAARRGLVDRAQPPAALGRPAAAAPVRRDRGRWTCGDGNDADGCLPAVRRLSVSPDGRRARCRGRRPRLDRRRVRCTSGARPPTGPRPRARPSRMRSWRWCGSRRSPRSSPRGSPPPGTGSTWSAAACGTRCSAGRSPTSTSPPTPARRPILAAAGRLGGRGVGHRDRVRHGRRRPAGRHRGDHHVPRRRLRRRDPQPGGRVRRLHRRATWSAATSR